MSDMLSRGAVTQLVNGEKPKPIVLQVLATKLIESGTSKRVRLNVSDGEHSLATTMLATQLNHLVLDGKIDNNAIIKLKDYQVSVLQKSRRVVVCLEIDVLKKGSEVSGVIGNPTSSNTIGKEPASTSDNVTSNLTAITGKENFAAPKSFESPKPMGKMNINGGTPQTPGGTPMRVMPIISLTPYQNKWTIKARVTQKGGVKEWKNARGEGKLFSFTVLDESGDIRATCFKEDVDRFFDLIEPGKAYYISNAQLKPANRQYNNTTHDYEMTMRRESMIAPCDESEVAELPKVSYNFIPVPKLTQHISQLVDVIGVLKSADDVTSVMIRSQNRETLRRNLHIVDKSGSEVQLTIWGNDAETFEVRGNPVVAFKSVRVSDYGGCSLSTVSSSMLVTDPDVPEAFELKQWFENGGCNQETQSMTQAAAAGSMVTSWKTLSEVKSNDMNDGDKPQYFTCKCTVLYVKNENVLYKACSNEGCNKKVIDLQNGEYRCEKCDKSSRDFKYRMILNMNIGDETDTTWTTCFQDQGEMILRMKANELGTLMEEDESKFNETLKNVNFSSYFMKLRVKMETYNDEERRKCTVVNVSPVAHADYARKLIEDIEKLTT